MELNYENSYRLGGYSLYVSSHMAQLDQLRNPDQTTYGNGHPRKIVMNLAEYFEANRPKPKYNFGDRVEGTYQGIPYVGTAYGDNMRSELEGPMVSIHLDLPMKIDSVWHNNIRVTYKQIKGLRT